MLGKSLWVTLVAVVHSHRVLTSAFAAAALLSDLPAAAQPASQPADDEDESVYDVANAGRTLFIATSSLDRYLGTRTTGSVRSGPAPFAAVGSQVTEYDLTVAPEGAFGLGQFVTMYLGPTGTLTAGGNGGTVIARGADVEGGGFLGLIFSPWERDIPHRARWSINVRAEYDQGEAIVPEFAVDGLSQNPTTISLANGAAEIGGSIGGIFMPFHDWHVRADLAGAHVVARDWFVQGAVGVELVRRDYTAGLANALTSTSTTAAPRLGAAIGWGFVQLEYQLTVSVTSFTVGEAAAPATDVARTDNLFALDFMWPQRLAHLKAGVGIFGEVGIRNDGPLVQEETAPPLHAWGASTMLQYVF